jgi:excisionase family DNA binding protein
LPELNFSEAELDRLADLLADRIRARLTEPRVGPAAYTPKTLAAELDRTDRSIRAAIARGELQAVKRGRGYVIAAEAVADWARAPANVTSAPTGSPRRRRSRSEPGPMRRALGS